VIVEELVSKKEINEKIEKIMLSFEGHIEYSKSNFKNKFNFEVEFQNDLNRYGID